jgi:hypothetical protein
MNTNVRWLRVLVSLLLAAFLWASVKLTRVYNTVIEIPVRYTNLPSGLKLQAPLPARLRLAVNGRGHRLFLPSTRLFADSLEIDLGENLEKGYLATASLSTQIESMLPEQTTLISVKPDTLPLHFAEKIRKKVPVRTRVLMQPTSGFYLNGTPYFRPDSVWLTATAKELKNITEWPTVDTTIRGIREDQRVSIPLQMSRDILVVPDHVSTKVTVLQYTERSLNIHPEWQGTRANGQMRLVPSFVKVTFQVPFDRFDQVNEGDFLLTVRLPDDPNESTIIPELTRAPAFVRQVRFDPPVLRYVITH